MKIAPVLTGLFMAAPFLTMSTSTPLAAQPVTFTTEAYPPFVTMEDGKPGGLTVEITRRMMERAGLDYRLEVVPWARAFAMAKGRTMTCVFAAARTPEREPQFKWVEPPLHTAHTFLVKLKGGIQHAETIEQARHYTVGTHRGDFTEALLREKGFERIDIATDFTASLNKLVLGRIDLMPMSDETIGKMTMEGKQLEPVVKLSESRLAYACNKAMPDELVRRMSESLAALDANGEKAAILRAWKEPARH